MSSCLSGGGRAYRLNLDLIKPATTFSASNSSSSSPSSTLSESSNSPPLSIFTRKPRTPRKRPNQTYNEAAAILSSAYPKLFPPKNLPKSFKLAKSHGGDGGSPFLPEPPDLLIADGGCLPASPMAIERPCRSPGEVTSSPRGGSSEICDELGDEFYAESILDEEVEEGIESIMGKLRVEGEIHRDSSNYCYGFPVGMGFDFRCGRMNELRAMRNVGEGDWWRSPSVNVVDVTPAIARVPAETETKAKTTKKKKTTTKTKSLASCSSSIASDELKKENLAPSEDSVPLPTQGLSLKLNYDDVLSAWSDKGSAFTGEAPAAGNDVQGRLAQIELFPARGAIVLRYKEKQRTLLFSKKIRYQVRKANADQRLRIKGRFVRTPYSVEDD